jgi:hypothetical protein
VSEVLWTRTSILSFLQLIRPLDVLSTNVHKHSSDIQKQGRNNMNWYSDIHEPDNKRLGKQPKSVMLELKTLPTLTVDSYWCRENCRELITYLLIHIPLTLHNEFFLHFSLCTTLSIIMIKHGIIKMLK